MINNQYNTLGAGLAKEAAAREYAADQLVGSGTGYATSDNAAVRSTPLQATCDVLDQVIGLLVELRKRQDGFVDRVRGPFPESPVKGEPTCAQYGGALGAVEGRLSQLTALAQRVFATHVDFIDPLA